MPDPDPTLAPVPAASTHSYSWQQLARDIITLIQVVALAYVARIGTTVENRQEQVKTTLEKKSADERQGRIINLLGTWKWLESIADESGKPKDREAAERAKKIYEGYMAENGD